MRAAFSLVAALAVLASCASESGGRPSVVLIVVDTLRADRLGAYGSDRDLSPALDRLAAGGLVFEQAVSPSSYTREAVASLFTGALPGTSGAHGWRAAPGAHADTLAVRFRRAGYRTVAASNSVMIRDERFLRGFEVRRFPGASQMHGGGGPRLTRTALRAVGDEAGGPFFLYVHYLDPHGPYEPPGDRRTQAAPLPEAERVGIYDDVLPRLDELRAGGFGPGERRFEDLRSRYEAELTATDAAIAALLDGLGERGLLENTIVLVTSDHGEEFLEHGFVEHAWTLYEESVRVPLLLSWPGVIEPGRVARRVSTVDVAPTLARLARLPEATHRLDGRSLLERDGRRFVPRAASGDPLHGELLLPNRLVVHSVSQDGWKYIVWQRWLTGSERQERVRSGVAGIPTDRDLVPVDPRAAPVREELYHLDRDPGETRDLAAAEPERLATLRALWEQRRERIADAPVQPAPDRPLDPEERRQLEALGYLAPGSEPDPGPQAPHEPE